MKEIEILKGDFLTYLKKQTFQEDPENLYAPINYILHLGGKRIRPVLALAAAELFGENAQSAMPVAFAVELFHNFSLIHDDIMDKADLRRGKPSVHTKWDLNTGILSGDMVLIEAYDQLKTYPAEICKELFVLFSKTAKEVCIGQQMDMDFETMEHVEIADYIEMISLKTSVLLACSLQMGAIVAGASKTDQNHLYNFGKNLGIAFQIQDDILDTYGTEAVVGKKIGGDIIQNKKTYLYLKSLELGTPNEKQNLERLYSSANSEIAEEKISMVKDIFNSTYVKTYADELKTNYRDLALSHLDAIQIIDEKKAALISLVKFLDSRTV